MNQVATTQATQPANLTFAAQGDQLPVISGRLDAMKSWAQKLVITSIEERDAAIRQGAVVRELIKSAEAEKAKVYKPVYDAAVVIRGKYDAVIKPMEEVDRLVKARVSAFEQARLAELERKAAEERRIREEAALKERQEAEAAAAAEAARIKAEADAKAAEAAAQGKTELAEAITASAEAAATEITAEAAKATDESFTLASAKPEFNKTIRTGEGGTGPKMTMVKRTKWEVTDLAKVPVQFLQVDSTAVNAAVKGGNHSIPGITVSVVEEAVWR